MNHPTMPRGMTDGDGQQERASEDRRHPNYRECHTLIPAGRVMVAVDWPTAPTREQEFRDELVRTLSEALRYLDGDGGALRRARALVSDAPPGSLTTAAAALGPLLSQDEIGCSFRGRTTIVHGHDARGGEVDCWTCPLCGFEHEER